MNLIKKFLCKSCKLATEIEAKMALPTEAVEPKTYNITLCLIEMDQEKEVNYTSVLYHSWFEDFIIFVDPEDKSEYWHKSSCILSMDIEPND